MFSRQDYKAIGFIIKESFNNPPKTSEEQEIHYKLVYELCNYFKNDNPRFDRQRFIEFVNRKVD